MVDDEAEVSRLIAQFEGEDTASLADADDSAKDGIVARLEELDDARVLPFLLAVAQAQGEYDLARVEALKALKLRPRAAGGDTSRIAAAIARLLDGEPDEDVRQYAAMAASAYMDDPEVARRIEAILFDGAREGDDIRSSALAAVERAGSSAHNVRLLQRLAGSGDGDFDKSARRVLRGWGLGDSPDGR